MSEDSKEYYEQTGVAMTCRSYEEYARMFACDWGAGNPGPILDAAGGASSFAASARRLGLSVVSADPLYRLTAEEMEVHGLREMEDVTAKLVRTAHRFDWSYYGTPEAHERGRRESFAEFIGDYRVLRGTGAYVEASLPELPFPDGSFQYALCSHFLFLYAEQFGYDFHLKALLELARVCRPGGEVRVYPLLDLKWNPYPELERLLGELRGHGLTTVFTESRLPFIPGSTRLLRIVRDV